MLVRHVGYGITTAGGHPNFFRGWPLRERGGGRKMLTWLKIEEIVLMPRTSAAAQEIVARAIPATPMEPPSDLTPEQREFWAALVGSLPTDWFAEDDRPLLVELMRHMSYSRKLSEQISLMRHECLNASTPHVSKQRTIFLRLVRAAALETETISKLCTRLRLTPQSQQRSRDAGIARSRSARGPRPWDDWSRDESAGQQ
jgi:hypothetical protein